MQRLRQVSITTLIFMIRERKRLASGALLAPMQFPTMPQDAFEIPLGNIKSRAQIENKMTWAAYSSTPRVPAISARISRLHHSAQIMTVDGSEIFRYSPQPLRDSLFG